MASATQRSARVSDIDGLRGYLLAMMYLAHLSYLHENPLYYFHHGRYSAVIDGEFFVLISGLVCALAYHGVYERSGLSGCWRVVVPRVAWLFLYQAVSIALTALIFWWADPVRVTTDNVLPAGISLGTYLYRSIAMVQLLPYVSILPLYMVLILFVPLGFWLLSRGRIKTFFGIIVFFWYISALRLDDRLVDYLQSSVFDWSPYVGLAGHFNPYSWAIIFFTGFFLGYRVKTQGSGTFIKRVIPLNRTFFWAAMVFNLAMALVAARSFLYGGISEMLLNNYRERVSPLALISIVCLAYPTYCLLVKAQNDAANDTLNELKPMGAFLHRILLWSPLQLSGRNALFIYAAHVPLTFFISYLLVVGNPRSNVFVIMAAVLLGGVVLLMLSQLKRRWFPSLP